MPKNAVVTDKPKNKGGRPTKYRPEFCQDIVEFFDRPLYITKTRKEWVDGEERIIEFQEPNDTPFLIKWCMKVGVSHDAVEEWVKKYPEFRVSYMKCKKLLEYFLTELGIKGDHNGFMTFQTLKNVSGWRDKHEVVNSGETTIHHKVEAVELEDRIKCFSGN